MQRGRQCLASAPPIPSHPLLGIVKLASLAGVMRGTFQHADNVPYGLPSYALTMLPAGLLVCCPLMPLVDLACIRVVCSFDGKPYTPARLVPSRVLRMPCPTPACATDPLHIQCLPLSRLLVRCSHLSSPVSLVQ